MLALVLIAVTVAGCGKGSQPHDASHRGLSVADVVKAFRLEGLSVADTGLLKPSDGQPVVGWLFGFAGKGEFDIEVFRSAQFASQFAAVQAPAARGETRHWRRVNVVVYFAPGLGRQNRDRILRAIKRLH